MIHVRLVGHLGKAELKHILEHSGIKVKVKKSHLNIAANVLMAEDEFIIEK